MRFSSLKRDMAMSKAHEYAIRVLFPRGSQMERQFKYDTDDVKTIPGLGRPSDNDPPFLTPVFFNSHVLVRFFHDPRYHCEFCSESYGTLSDVDGEFSIPFGINPNGKVVAWLGDLLEVPENDRAYFALENIESDHDIRSEFYDSQINVAFTDPILEVELLLLKSKFAVYVREKFGVEIYTDPTEFEWADIRTQCSKYKRIVFNDIDDFKRFVSEWYEVLVEDLSRERMHRYFEDNGIERSPDWRELKSLEQFLVGVMGDRDNIIAPLYYLSDLRIWADHKGATSKYEQTISRLGLDSKADPQIAYRALITELRNAYRQMLKIVVID